MTSEAASALTTQTFRKVTQQSSFRNKKGPLYSPIFILIVTVETIHISTKYLLQIFVPIKMSWLLTTLQMSPKRFVCIISLHFTSPQIKHSPFFQN